MSVTITPQPQKVQIAASPSIIKAGASIIKEELPEYSGPTTVIPTTEEQTLETAGKKMPGNVTVEAMPPADWQQSANIPAQPVLSMDSATGIITATVDAEAEVFPLSESGYADASHSLPIKAEGTETLQIQVQDKLTASGKTVTAPAGFYPANVSESVADASWRGGSTLEIDPAISVDADGLITASYDSTIPVTPLNGSGWAERTRTYPVRAHGSKTQQLPALPATSYTPGASPIIIPRGKFLTGDQTIEAVSPPYYDMSGDMAWLGKGAELVDGSLYSATFKLSETAYKDWTPSTTAGVCVASVTQNAKFAATDMANNEYAIIWECGFDPVWDGTETKKALPLLSRAYLVQQLFRRPNSWALIQESDFNANTCASAFTGTFMRYYGTTTGTATYTFAASYGFYFALVSSTFSSGTSDNPNVNLKTPTMSARCNTTYFSTGNAAKIDSDKSTGFIRGKLYRIKRDGFLRGVYNNVVRLINAE